MSFNKVYITASPIHGCGVFSNMIFHKGDVIIANCIDHTTQKVTYFGRYVNHSSVPNSILIYNAGYYHLVALKTIYPNTEIVADYYFTPNYINKPQTNWK